MQFDQHSVFEYRGPKHRVVCEMPEKDRTTEAMETANLAWEKRNKKRKAATRTTADRPLWSVSHNLLLPLRSSFSIPAFPSLCLTHSLVDSPI